MNKFIKVLLQGLMLSLPLSLIVSNIYANFYNGFSKENAYSFSHFAFWDISPFAIGYVPDAFITSLQLAAGILILGTVAFTTVMFSPKIEHHGTAQWGDLRKMRELGFVQKYGEITGPIFGKTSSPERGNLFLTNGDHPHALVVAPTRAGKGVGVVIPTLLTFDGSVIALDVKGELFESTSRSRIKRGDKVFKFSPLDVEGRTHSYNPILDIVAAPPERRFMETRRLASNLIVTKGKGAEGFIDGARDLFVAGVLACIERGMPTIGAVYDLFALPGEKYKLFSQLAEESQIPEVKRIFNNMASNDTKIITSYTSVLGDGGLNLWADQLIKNATETSDFSIYDLRRDPTSVFIVVSPNDLEVIAPLIRLLFQQLASILQRTMPEEDETFEVLFLLDEFKHLGKLEAIETAITTIAGYKGRFMFIIQSLSALTANYEQSGKENFLGNTGIQIFMATADEETPQYISKAIGDYTYKSQSKSWQKRQFFDTNIQESHQGAALIRPEQLRLLDDDTQIVLVKGQPPLKMPKVKFYADKILKKLYEDQTGPLPEPDAKQIDYNAAPKSPIQQEKPEENQSQSSNEGLEQEIQEPKPVDQISAEETLSIDAAATNDDSAIPDYNLQHNLSEIANEPFIPDEYYEESAKADVKETTDMTAQQELLDKIIQLQKETGSISSEEASRVV